jgi:hypothetical protein
LHTKERLQDKYNRKTPNIAGLICWRQLNIVYLARNIRAYSQKKKRNIRAGPIVQFFINIFFGVNCAHHTTTCQVGVE